jgi:hypothetical protein
LAICVAALFVVLPRCVATSPSSWWCFEITGYRVLMFPASVLPAVTCVAGTRTRCRTGCGPWCAWPSSARTARPPPSSPATRSASSGPSVTLRVPGLLRPVPLLVLLRHRLRIIRSHAPS